MVRGSAFVVAVLLAAAAACARADLPAFLERKLISDALPWWASRFLCGDVDGDQWDDLVAYLPDPAYRAFFMRNMKGGVRGSFYAPEEVRVNRTQAVALRPVTASSRSDILIGTDQRGLHYATYRGTPLTLSTITSSTTPSARFVDMTDMDLDGLDDYVYVDGSGKVSYHEAYADGGFRSTEIAVALPSDYSSIGMLVAFDAAVCDINKDGFKDIIVATLAMPASKLYVLTHQNATDFANFTGTFASTVPAPYTIKCVDLNNDGYDDVIVLNLGEGVFYQLNDKNGSFGLPVAILNQDIGDIALVDMDDNGYLDLVYADLDSSVVGIVLNSNGVFASTPVVVCDDCSILFSVGVCDVDRDSHPDIIASVVVDGKAHVYLFENAAPKPVTCYDKPCKHGFCVAQGLYDHYCDCTSTGYTGADCSQKLPFNCSVTPCSNGGVCLDTFICDCAGTDHSGEDCTLPGLIMIWRPFIIFLAIFILLLVFVIFVTATRSGDPLPVLGLFFSVFNLITNILFYVELNYATGVYWGFSDLDLTLEHRLLLASILIFVFGNALFLTHIFFRSNTLRAYIHKYPIHFYAALIFVFFGVENYSILDTHLFRYPFLYAKWSVPTANLLRIYGVVGSLILDIPHLVIYILVSRSIDSWLRPRWLLVSFVATCIVLLWSLYSRVVPLFKEYVLTEPLRRDRRPSIALPPDMDADEPLPERPAPKVRASMDGDSPRNSTEAFLATRRSSASEPRDSSVSDSMTRESREFLLPTSGRKSNLKPPTTAPPSDL